MRPALLGVVAVMGALVFAVALLLRPPTQRAQPAASALFAHQHERQQHGAAAAAGGGDEEQRSAVDSAACPDRPTWRRFASWDEWAGPNCSFAVPYVLNPADQHGQHTAGTHPLFVVIGEQKGGTTFLRALLNQHPQLRAGTGLFGLEAGETHYFDQGITMRHLPTDPKSLARAYADYFTVPFHDVPHEEKNATSVEQTEQDMPFGFDTTPSLLAWRGPAAWRLALVRPRTKLVLLVRDPVARYESARRMYLCISKAAQERGEDFHEEGEMEAYLRAAAAVDKERHQPEEQGEGGKRRSRRRQFWRALPLRRGMYMENLKAFLLHFPDPSDLLVLDSHKLFADPAAVARGVAADFLRLPDYEPDVAAAEKVGRNAVHAGCSSTLTGGRAAGEYRLRADDRAALARFYHPHNQALEAFLGRQFPSWTRPDSD